MDFINYAAAFIISGIGAWIIYKYAFKWGFIDHPNDRSSHGRNMPKGGGVGLLAVFILTSFSLQWPLSHYIPAAFIALFSFFIDKIEISPRLRLIIQFVAAMLFIFGAKRFNIHSQDGLILIVLSTIYIVGTTNFYNFMDGINGIAAITGIVGFGLFAFFSFYNQNDSVYFLLAVCISLSCLGFLPFNFPNAKVFMGDVGSILLGFVFAELVVLSSRSFLDFICYSSFIFPFYADELTTMAVRLKKGENLFNPHRSHIYQHLANELGVSHWKVSLGYGLVQLIIGTAVWLTKPLGLFSVLILFLFFFGVFGYANYAVRNKISADYVDFAD